MLLPQPYNLTTDIAVIGAACHFPQAGSVAEFWNNIVTGVVSVKDFSEQELRAAGVSQAMFRQERYVARGVVLQDHDRFDPTYFGYTPREAEVMNPEQRLLLQCSHHALEDAGYDPQRFTGRIGAFVGVSAGHYLYENVLRRPDVVQRVGMKTVQFGNDPTFAATHLAYRLHLRGPAIALHTACSTSLVAVHLACRSLMDFECEMALAGGAHIAANHGKGYLYQEGGILARDGYCRPFDAQASGTISGSGAGAVLLKRLEDAIAAGDHVIAVIKSTAVNNDGADKVGFSAPSVSGQREVISTALEHAETHPEWIGFHETHGTGTILGDPIEIEALTAAHRRGTQATGYCALGALKANVGHMATAAGIGGFIKVCQVLAAKTIPPLARFQSPNPALHLERSPFRVPTTAQQWTRSDVPRFASLSAFGMGGTNAHAILCEAPESLREPSTKTWHLWPLSASTPEALTQLKQSLQETVQRLSPAERADAAFTLSIGRRQQTERDYLLVPSTGSPLNGVLRQTLWQPKVALVFPGQGAQYPGMAATCYASEPAYRRAVDECLERLAPLIDYDLRDLLLNPHASEERLRETDAAQSALFVSSYACARLWEHWGLQPAALIGHSIGEYVAACISGALSLDTALELVAHRGRLMCQAPAGAMLAVNAAEAQIVERLRGVLPEIDIAAVNTPQSCVLSGEESAIAAAMTLLRQANVATTRLHTSRAFHSRAMDAAALAFESIARQAPIGEARIPYVSNVTGEWITAADLRDPAYWSKHIRQTVRFAAGIRRLLESGIHVFLEAGPGQSMTRMLRSVPQWSHACVASSARHVQGAESDLQVLTESFGALWSMGVPLLPARRYDNERRQRMPLPLTAFARDRYWIEPGKTSVVDLDPPVSSRSDDWLYLPAWKREASITSPASKAAAHWLLLGPEDALLTAIAERVRSAGARATHVRAGAQRRWNDSCVIDIRPDKSADYELLDDHVRSASSAPLTIVYGWPLECGDSTPEAAQSALSAYLSFLQDAAPLLHLESVRVLLLTRRGASIAGEPIDPAQAMLGAATQVVRHEHPGLDVTWVDVDDRTHADKIAIQVVEEAALKAPIVALRGGQRWLPDYVPARAPVASTKLTLHGTGCYLITGGLGGIGLSIAEHFAATRPVKLVLVGRTELPPREQWPALESGTDRTAECIRRIQAIERTGSEVMTAAADVSDEPAMRRVVTTLQERFGRCHGVIHAAGVVAGAMLMRQSAATIAAALAPKVNGLLVLERVLPAESMDFVLLCSSINALKGGVGRFGYAAANAYLDAYAQARALTDKRIIVRSLNWSAWAETGMAVAQARSNARRRSQMLLTAEALSILDRALMADEPRLVASKVPVDELLTRDADSSTEMQDSASTSTSRPRPAHVRAEYAPPENERETRIAAIWTDVLGVSLVGRQDDFFELGGNSLMMIQVGARIQECCGVALSAQSLFSAVTVQQLAAHLAPSEDATVAELRKALEALPAADLLDVLEHYAKET
jgi:phthiocerol/phenolphthiocerol synthesis type-I polyketide synthase E